MTNIFAVYVMYLADLKMCYSLFDLPAPHDEADSSIFNVAQSC